MVLSQFCWKSSTDSSGKQPGLAVPVPLYFFLTSVFINGQTGETAGVHVHCAEDT